MVHQVSFQMEAQNDQITREQILLVLKNRTVMTVRLHLQIHRLGVQDHAHQHQNV